MTEQELRIFTAAIQGLCSSAATSERSPQSIVKKAQQILEEAKKAFEA